MLWTGSSTSTLHAIQSRCCRHLLRYSPAHLPHSSVFSLIRDSGPGEAARVDSLCDCTRWRIQQHSEVCQAATSLTFRRQRRSPPVCSAVWEVKPAAGCVDLISSVLGVGQRHPHTHTHARADPCVHVATVYCGNRWFSFITSRQFFLPILNHYINYLILYLIFVISKIL